MRKTIRVIQIIPGDFAAINQIHMDAGDYRAFYPLLDCSTFDVARSLGSDWFPPHWDAEKREAAKNIPIDIYCDDEGLWKPAPLFGTMLPTGQALAGNLVLASSNDEGETIGLPDWFSVELVTAMVTFGTLGERVQS